MLAARTFVQSVFFFSSIWFLVFEVCSKTTPDKNASRQRIKRGITFETDNPVQYYDSRQANEFQPCDSSSYCAPIRRCSSLRHLWHSRNVGTPCGPFRRVCCPKGVVPTVAISPLDIENFEAVLVSLFRENATRPRAKRRITSEIDNSLQSYDSVQANKFQSCDSSSYCTPVRQCSSLRHLWHKRNVGTTCGPFRRVCCPREVVPTSTASPLAIEINEAIPDDSQAPDRFQTCDAFSYCIPIRKCSSFREGWNRRGVGITCGLGEGQYRMVCCPRGFGMEVQVPQEFRQTRPPRTTTSLPPPGRGNSEDCGLNQGMDWFREQSTNGTESFGATWPWMVAIAYQDPKGFTTDAGSGFLIDKIHVLTTATVLGSKRNKERFIARIGSDEKDLGEEYRIREVKVHENYNSSFFYHDIAILTLAREANVSNFVPICLPDERIAAKDLTGWGVTIVGWGSEIVGGPQSNSLKQLDNVPIVSNRECNQIFESKTSSFKRQFPRGITGDMLCAGQTEGSREACFGDAGGPAMIFYKKRWFAVGITSFGYICGVPGMPGGYTRVSSYVDWIRNNTQKSHRQRSTKIPSRKKIRTLL